MSYPLEEEFLPANVFTPNGDGCNDFFAMEGEYATCNGGQALIKGLPFDNCRNSFQKHPHLQPLGQTGIHQ